jgi:uncharacterized membrane protein YphA (DoxX/SURF4 family)
MFVGGSAASASSSQWDALARQAPQNPFRAHIGGDAAIVCCSAILYCVFAGSGAWSLDALRFSSAGQESRA